MVDKLSNALLVLFFIIISLSPSHSQQRYSIGDQHSLYSDILDQDRTILVGLPRDYNENKSYPVLYVLDGEHYSLLANSLTDFLHHRAEKIPEMIVVAIPNIYRNTDMTPLYETDDPNARTIEFSGGGDNFLSFIKLELMPFIADRYSSSGNNILFGHSAAGLFATYSILEDPSLFSSYIISDPSLWYGEAMLIKKLNANLTSYFGIRKNIYMTHIDRTKDKEDIMSKPQAEFMKLIAKLPNVNAVNMLVENENHSTAPLKSLRQGLEYIFQDYKPDET